MRVELRDGQWAELRERINHATDKDLKRAIQRGKLDPMLRVDFETEVASAFVRAWHVIDPETGEAIPLGPGAMDRAPEDIVEVLAEEAARVWMDATVPNAPTPPSSDD